jgi:hypothetical protein
MTNRFKLSEAATAILEGSKETFDSNITAKRGQRELHNPEKVGNSKLSASVAYGMKDDGKIGSAPNSVDDAMPDFTKNTPTATPPGATPPVSAQAMMKLKNQPGQKASGDTGNPKFPGGVEEPETSYDNIRDRVAMKKPKQTMPTNPGANLQAYGEELDMSVDVNALLEGENLSEDFKQKATTIFEAAVMSRIEVIAEQVEQQLVEQFEEAVEQIKEDLASKVDDYLNYMVEEWMQQNELAVDTGLRAEIAEDFINGLHNLFVEHYIDVPEDKVDVVSEMAAKVAELEEALNEQISRGIDLTKELNEQKKIEAIYTACEGLAQTQVEKLKSLAEGVEFTTEEEFVEKLEVLKESYFQDNVVVADNSAFDEVLVEEEKREYRAQDSLIEHYASGISKTLK